MFHLTGFNTVGYRTPWSDAACIVIIVLFRQLSWPFYSFWINMINRTVNTVVVIQCRNTTVNHAIVKSVSSPVLKLIFVLLEYCTWYVCIEEQCTLTMRLSIVHLCVYKQFKVWVQCQINWNNASHTTEAIASISAITSKFTKQTNR